MGLWKTKLKRFSGALLVITIATVLLLMYKYFLMSAISLIVFVILWPIWFRSLSEELVVSFLKRHDGHCNYDELVEEYSEKILPSISRLEKRAVVEVKDNVVTVIDENYVCAFDKFRKR